MTSTCTTGGGKSFLVSICKGLLAPVGPWVLGEIAIARPVLGVYPKQVMLLSLLMPPLGHWVEADGVLAESPQQP